MAQMIKAGLPIDFLNHFENVILKNKNHISTAMINEGYALLNLQIPDSSCSQCIRNNAVELMNRYNAMLPDWNEYKSNLIKEKTRQENEIVVETTETPEVKQVSGKRKASK